MHPCSNHLIHPCNSKCEVLLEVVDQKQTKDRGLDIGLYTIQRSAYLIMWAGEGKVHPRIGHDSAEE
jgi:hypothetical protein